jgi:hypothetical protein
MNVPRSDRSTLYSQVVATAITKEQLEGMKQLAHEQSMTMSTYLRRMIIQEIKQHGMLTLQSKPPSNRK